MKQVQWELTLPGEPKKSRFKATYQDGLITIQQQTLLHRQASQPQMATGPVIVTQIPRNLLPALKALHDSFPHVDGPDIVEAAD